MSKELLKELKKREKGIQRFYFSDKMEKGNTRRFLPSLAKTNYVLSDGTWKRYNQWCSGKENPAFDDSVLICEMKGIDWSRIQVGGIVQEEVTK